VEDDDARVGEVDELLAKLVAREDQGALISLEVLTHARPDVGGQDVRPDRRALGIVCQLDGATCLGGDLLCPVHHLGDRLEARRCGDADGHAGLRPRQQ
jgi:hypothetical protein